jgi:glycosyltransferase involved in cell wall biosynthesis
MTDFSLSVVIPSRVQPEQANFLRRAVASIRNQSIVDRVRLQILVGVDAGTTPEPTLADELSIEFVESSSRSQAAALNAAMRRATSDVIAFLEDDDEWQPNYIEAALHQLSSADFVSSTQLEYDEHGVVLRINDFPTPSGWLMKRTTMLSVGVFNESFRFHLDNEWLGRLAQIGAARVHLVESTAVIDDRLVKQVRPWLHFAVALSDRRVRLVRHDSPYPLVKRLVHRNSGMAQIAQSAELSAVSQAEQGRLTALFGRIPW